MARIKLRPRLAQPDPEPQGISPAAQGMSNALNALKEFRARAKQRRNDDESQNSDNQTPSKPVIDSDSEQPRRTEDRSADEQLLMIGQSAVITDIDCPNCGTKFSDMGIKDFREHVESCTRPTTADSESDTSSLSPPPDSHHGEVDEPGESSDFSNVVPYVRNAYVYYPESGQDAAGDAAETADGQTRILMPKITDADVFIDLIDGIEEMDYDEAYQRILFCQQALVAWQDEWLALDRFIKKKEPATTANAHKNPRVPRPTQIGIGYQDELESFMYGFQYQYHQAKVGNQDPENQRYTNGASGGRELRQRVPTQKAAEADLSSSQDSDDGIGARRRTRGQKAKEVVADVDMTLGRSQRTKNNSRIDSESRGQTPVSTVTSKKSRGRPPKSKAAGASRLQELQFEEASDYDSAAEPTYGQEHVATSDQLETAASNRPLETTEHWNDFTDPDEQVSRPGTSDSTMTGATSDSAANPRLRLSGRNRRRKNTSDFEDALPSHKRLGGKAKSSAVNGVKESDPAQALKEEKNLEKTRNTRRGRQEETKLPGAPNPTENVLNESALRSQDGMGEQSSFGTKDGTTHKKQGGRKIVTLKSSSGRPLTPVNSAAAKEAVTDPLLSSSVQQDGKDGPKYSRASLNMMRRWAAKKQAEALGLPVPKIGRYPKGGSIPSTPDVVGSPDLTTSPRPLGGRKRKRDEEPDSANFGVSEHIAVAVEALTPKKKNRGGRPKKAVNGGPTRSAESAGQDMNGDGNGSNISPSEVPEKEEDAIIPVLKKKGGRPRKKPLEITTDTLFTDSPAPNGQEANEQNNQTGFVLRNDNGQADVTRRAASMQIDHPKNDGDLDTAESVEKAETVPVLRKSGRVRRQTSAAASSQAGTRRGSKSSQKTTVTPTPGPSQQASNETMIKQESTTGPALPKKRGRQQKLIEPETTPEGTVIAASIDDDEQPPPPKRRRVVRSRIAASTSSTPAPVADLEETRITPQDEQVVIQKQFSRKRKTPIQDTSAPEMQSDAHTTSAEPSIPRKGVQKASTEDTLATGVQSDAQASSVEPILPKKKAPGRPRKNANSGPAPGWVNDEKFKAEDVPRTQEPLTTRARSSIQENTAKINSVESLEDEEGETIDPESIKRKQSSWGGRRLKGLSASTAAIDPRLDTNTRKDRVEDKAQADSSSPPDSNPQEPLKRGTWGGPRQKRVITVPVEPLADMEDEAAEPAGPSNTPSRPKRAMSNAILTGRDSSIDDEAAAGLSSRPKRIISMKPARLSATTDNEAGTQSKATPASESVTPELKKGEKKGGQGEKRVKDVVDPKVEPDDGGYESEATAKAKRREAAILSKSEKMSRSMKERWADGSMREIMNKKKAANAAKKAAAALAAENGDEVIPEPAFAAASAPTKRHAPPVKDGGRAAKRRRTVDATMDGAADTDTDLDIPDAPSSGPTSPLGRKMAGFERYRNLSSPLRSAHSRRKRRSAALRATQSFSKFTDDGDDVEMMDDEEEDVDIEIKKQFDSEYEHYRDGKSLGLETSNILSGKRKRKPVINLEEAMRIEAGDEDDFSMEG